MTLETFIYIHGTYLKAISSCVIIIAKDTINFLSNLFQPLFFFITNEGVVVKYCYCNPQESYIHLSTEQKYKSYNSFSLSKLEILFDILDINTLNLYLCFCYSLTFLV